MKSIWWRVEISLFTKEGRRRRMFGKASSRKGNRTGLTRRATGNEEEMWITGWEEGKEGFQINLTNGNQLKRDFAFFGREEDEARVMSLYFFTWFKTIRGNDLYPALNGSFLYTRTSLNRSFHNNKFSPEGREGERCKKIYWRYSGSFTKEYKSESRRASF